MVMQQRPQIVPSHQPRPTMIIFHGEHAALGLGVEATVADEVEDVVGVAPQLTLQGAQCRLRQPHHLHPPPLGELAERCGDVAPFLVAIQLLQI
jgi:hypothetical protein